MSILPFLLGLVIGLSVCFWKQYQFNHQINQILSSLPNFEKVKSLSAISLIRRTINIFNSEYQALKLELETNEYLLDNHPLGYLKIDSENQLIWCNKKARNLLKINRWQEKQIRLFLELVLSFELDTLIQQTRQTQQELMIEWDFYPHENDLENDENNQKNSNNNYQYPLFLKAYSYPLSEGNVAIFIENKQDIKTLKENKNRFFADLSHELRTPLTVISLLTEVLLNKIKTPEKTKIERINQEIQRLINLVQKWLEISQLEENPYQKLEYQQLDLKQLIISAWQSLELLALQKNINFSYENQQNIQIEADLNLLTQVFINLFDNAIKNSHDQGIIEVKVNITNNQSQSIEIDIIDSGIGFREEDLPHIFERLYRGDKSRVKNDRQGNGLGLAIVKEIISAHNGSIIAKNHPQKAGAWLKIILPSQNETEVENL